MPKITITEEYNPSTQFLATDHVVYIPGFSSKDEIKPGVPTLFTSVEDFKEKIGTAPVELGVDEAKEEDKSYLLAYELLKLGAHVLYELPSKKVEDEEDDEEDEKEVVSTVEEMQEALSTTEFWERLTDRGAYNIRFLTAGAYLDTEIEPAVPEEGQVPAVPAKVSDMITNMISAAKKRGDAVALIDHSIDKTTPESVQEYFNAIGSIDEAEYAAGFTPHVPVVFEAAASNKPISVPGTFGYLLAFARSVQSNPSWLSIAGARRGRIPGLLIKSNAPQMSIKYGENDANLLQGKSEGDIAVNPIVEINPYGILIWGNRTLKSAPEDEEKGLGAKHFLNIRNLVSSIRKTLFVASRGQTFEQNDDILWINFKAAITPLLDQMKSGGGIADYKLFKKASKAKATLTAVIRIVPIEAVEDFDLTIDLKDSVDTINE